MKKAATKIGAALLAATVCLGGGALAAQAGGQTAVGHTYQSIGSAWVHYGVAADGRYTYRLSAGSFNRMMEKVAADTYEGGAALGVWLWGTTEEDNANYFIDDVRLLLVTEEAGGVKSELIKGYDFDDGSSKGGGAPGALVTFDPEVRYGGSGYSLHITNRTSYTRSYRLSGLTAPLKELGQLKDNQYLAVEAYIRADSDEEPVNFIPLIYNFYSDYGGVYLESYFEATLRQELEEPTTSPTSATTTTAATTTTTAAPATTAKPVTAPPTKKPTNAVKPDATTTTGETTTTAEETAPPTEAPDTTGPTSRTADQAAATTAAPENPGGLSTGAIVGIAVGSVVLAGIVIAAIVLVRRKKA